ncbi:hypothetical protein AAG570_001102 [Ranatra chinensis]|uniref:Uncharacterized protein n=1 Tax=Ranatra chinensis TaxID=642074 RepID=A0ABD0YB47_9HEMI
MGVKGLWQLIDSAGKPVPVESLENRILAVVAIPDHIVVPSCRGAPDGVVVRISDYNAKGPGFNSSRNVSIWLHQLVKGFSEGSAPSKGGNAHLLGLFRRICKLLYFRIRPVFVFDGGVPALKRKTIAARQNVRSQATKAGEKARLQLLHNLAKQAALTGGSTAEGGFVLPPALVSAAMAVASTASSQDSIFKLPPLPASALRQSASSSDDSSDDEFSPTGGGFGDLHSIDVTSPDFLALPPDMRHAILSELKDTRKQNSWATIHKMPENLGDFSSFQMGRLLKRRSVQVGLEKAESEMGGRSFTIADIKSILTDDGIVGEDLSQRIASNDTTRFIYATTKPNSKEATTTKCKKRSLSPVKESDEDMTSDSIGSAGHNSSSDVLAVEDLNDEDELSQREILKMIQEQNKERVGGALSEVEGGFSISQGEKLKMEDGGLSGLDNTGDKVEDLKPPLEGRQEDNKSDEGVAHVSRVKIEDNASNTEDVTGDDKRVDTETGHGSQSFEPKVFADFGKTPNQKIVPGEVPSGSVTLSRSEGKSDGIGGSKDSESLLKQSPADQNGLSETALSAPEGVQLQGEKCDVICGAKRHTNSSYEEVSPSKRPCSGSDLHAPSGGRAEEGEAPAGKMDVSGIDADMDKRCVTSSEQPAEDIRAPEEKGSMDNSSDDDFEEVVGNEGSISSAAEGPTIGVVQKEKEAMDSSSVEGHDSTPVFKPNDEERNTINSQLNNTVDTSSSDDDDFLEVPSNREPGLEIVFDPSAVVDDDDDIFADVFSKPEKPLKNEPITVATPAPSVGPIESEVTEVKSLTSEVKTSDSSSYFKVDSSRDAEKVKPLTEEERADIREMLEKESVQLIAASNREDRLATSISDQLIVEAQELLRLFGIPYLVAPMEAEAQCAYLEHTGQTEGTISDDSDVWLFGADCVYKNFFNQNKYVMRFKAFDIQRCFKLKREDMVLLALLVGSDYTVGLEGVGPVTALEILAHFPPQSQDSPPQDRLARFKRQYLSGTLVGQLTRKLKSMKMTHGFPSGEVVRAYLEPTVNEDREPFSWSSPDLCALRQYARNKFGWDQKQTDKTLQPILDRVRQSTTQMTLHGYFDWSMESLPVKKSKRVISAVNMLGRLEEPSDSSREGGESTSALTSYVEPAEVAKQKTDPKKRSQGKSRNGVPTAGPSTSKSRTGTQAKKRNVAARDEPVVAEERKPSKEVTASPALKPAPAYRNSIRITRREAKERAAEILAKAKQEGGGKLMKKKKVIE